MSPRHFNPMMHLPVLLALAVLPMPSLESNGLQTTLASLRHDYRPLLIFAESANAEFREQIQTLAERTSDLEDRQILVIPVLFQQTAQEQEDAANTSSLPEAEQARLEPAECVLARRRFHVEEKDFAVVLVGKDAGEKLKSRTPVTIERLIKLIDSMPMRQKELRDGHTG